MEENRRKRKPVSAAFNIALAGGTGTAAYLLDTAQTNGAGSSTLKLFQQALDSINGTSQQFLSQDALQNVADLGFPAMALGAVIATGYSLINGIRDLIGHHPKPKATKLHK